MKSCIFIQRKKVCKRLHDNSSIPFFPHAILNKRKYRKIRPVRSFLYFSYYLVLKMKGIDCLCVKSMSKCKTAYQNEQSCKYIFLFVSSSFLPYAVFQTDYLHRQVYALEVSFYNSSAMFNASEIVKLNRLITSSIFLPVTYILFSSDIVRILSGRIIRS